MSDEYLLRAPLALTVLSDGSIVIGDDRPLQLRVYDREGRHVGSFAQPGGGPGDLTPAPFGWILRPAGEGEFQLWSGWPPRIQQWTLSGELHSVETFDGDHPIMSGMTPRTLAVTPTTVFWISSSYRTDSEDRTIDTSMVLAGGEAGSAPDTLLTIDHEPIPHEHQAVLQFGLGYAALLKDHLLITRANRCYLASWMEDWIVEYDLRRGRPVARFRGRHESDSIPEGEAVRGGRAFGAAEQARFDKGIAWLRERVSILGLAEGPGGQILVQRAGEAVDDVWPTDVFSADGEYLGRVMLPVEPRTTVVSDGELFGFGTSRGAPVMRSLRIDRHR
jgi:hypothetical protein